MFGSKTLCNVQLLGFTKKVLVDTGSQVSILPLQVLLDAAKSGFDLDADVEEVKVDDRINIYDASGRKMAFKGAVRLSLALQQEPLRRVVFFVRRGNDNRIVLGTNVLRAFGLQALLKPAAEMKRSSVSVQTLSSDFEKRAFATQTASRPKNKPRKSPSKGFPCEKVKVNTLVEKEVAKPLSATIAARVCLKPGETKRVSIGGIPSKSSISFDQLRKLPPGIDNEPVVTNRHRAKRGRSKKVDGKVSANSTSFRVEVGDPRFDPLHLLYPCQCGIFNTRAQVGLPGLRCDLARSKPVKNLFEMANVASIALHPHWEERKEAELLNKDSKYLTIHGLATAIHAHSKFCYEFASAVKEKEDVE
ncbi:hypothetical protein V3C99_000268 [Haemonchus contortus]